MGGRRPCLAAGGKRKKEIEAIQNAIDADKIYNLGLPTTKLDTLPLSDLIQKISRVFQNFKPAEVLVPHRGDVHSDHRIVFDATAACCKWFRYPSIERVMAYETLSETEFCLDPNYNFQPSVFINITDYLDKKQEVLQTYKSELSEFPFPRSIENVRALAQYRGATAGFKAAEAFQLLKERIT